jgi:hypothetical protein
MDKGQESSSGSAGTTQRFSGFGVPRWVFLTEDDLLAKYEAADRIPE